MQLKQQGWLARQKALYRSNERVAGEHYFNDGPGLQWAAAIPILSGRQAGQRAELATERAVVRIAATQGNFSDGQVGLQQ